MLFKKNIYFILLKPKKSGNIGSCARALKNFGFNNLRIVSNQSKSKTFSAKKMAVHADDLLEKAECFETLSQAINDLSIVVGTSGKFHKEKPESIDVYDMKDILSYTSNNKIGFLFGPEDRGLSNNEITYCNYTISLPTSEKYPSMNLSHALTVVAYELSKQIIPNLNKTHKKLADKKTMEKLYERMFEVYKEIKFLDKLNPERIMKVVRSIYDRNKLTPREAQIFMGILRQTVWRINLAKKSKL